MSGKDQKTHRVGFVFTGHIWKRIWRAQALTHVVGFLYSMTTQKLQENKLKEHTQFLGRMADAAKESLIQAKIAIKSENFEEADRLIAESKKYTRMAETADLYFQNGHKKGIVKRWTPYLDTYVTFFAGYIFATLLVIGYQLYIDRGTFIGQIFGWGFVALLLPILFVRESRPECRDCNGRILQPGENCHGVDHAGTDWRFVENGGQM